MRKVTWQDIEDVLFDGKRDEIAELRCPDCGGILRFDFNMGTMSSTLECTGCGTGQRGSGAAYIPNVVEYFGESVVLKNQ